MAMNVYNYNLLDQVFHAVNPISMQQLAFIQSQFAAYIFLILSGSRQESCISTSLTMLIHTHTHHISSKTNTPASK